MNEIKYGILPFNPSLVEIKPPPLDYGILLEDGGFILLEDGSKLLLEG